MAFVNNSVNMNLPIPETGVEPGPQYATDVNNCLTLVDQHNHSPGYGIAVPSAGLNINADLTIQNNNLINIRSDRYTVNAAPLALATDLACVYVAGKDLYYNDTAGNQVRITASGSVNATSSGISSGTASAAFSAGTLVVNQATNTPGNVEMGSVLLGNNTASSPYLTLAPPTLSGAYTITLPTLPASTLPLSISSVGNMSAAAITYAQMNAATQIMLNMPPTIQVFTSSSGTYTLPANCNYIKVRMVGGGGGGGGGTSSGANGGNGGNTTFGSSLLAANGGGGGLGSSGTPGGGAGGTASLGSGPIGMALTGGAGTGAPPNILFSGTPGPGTPFGGGGSGSCAAVTSTTAAPSNTGAGGAGGTGANTVGGAGGSGGAGGYVDAIITSPSATYSYSVGAGGTAGGGPNPGGVGGSGLIIVEEHYGS